MRLSLLGLFAFLLLACKSENKENVLEYSADGVSIKYSSDWILESEDYEGEGHYLSLEKKGFESSGLYQLYWLNDHNNIENLLEDQKRDLVDIPTFSGIRFSDNFKTNYGKFEGIASNYKIPLLEIEGTIISFSHDDKGFVVMKQQDYDTDHVNKKGFEIIENSLQINNKYEIIKPPYDEKKTSLFIARKNKIVGNFVFKTGRDKKILTYIFNDSSLEVENNSGGDIIFVFRPDLLMEIQIGEVTISKRYKLKFKEDISRKNPWKNGETRKINKGSYNQSFSFDDYALKNYTIVRANIAIKINAQNNYRDFKFNDTIYYENIEKELKKFKSSL